MGVEALARGMRYSRARVVQPLEFILFMLVALPLAIFLHELGHAIFGELAGLRVLALVVGTGRPLYTRRIRNTIFCIMSRPFFSGMAICVSPGIRTPRPALATFAIGGPLASFLTGALLLPLLVFYDSPVLGTFCLFSLALGVTNAMPFRWRVGGRIVRSDGMLAIGALRGTNDRDVVLGQSLAASFFILELFHKLSEREGEAHATTMVALSQLSLSDFDGAAETLASSALDGRFAHHHELIVRALLLAAVDPHHAKEAIDHARAQTSADHEAMVLFALAEAETAIARNDPEAPALAEAALRAAESSSFPQMITAAELCSMRAAPPPDPWDTGLSIIGRSGARKPSQNLMLDVWITVAEQLQARGDRRRALQAFDKAQLLVRRIAKNVGDPRIRARFFAARARALANVAPLEPLPEYPQRSAYRWISSGCAMAAALAYALFAIVVVQYRGDGFELFVTAMSASVLGFALAVIGALSRDTLRSLRVPLVANAVLVALPFAFLALR